MPTHFRTCHICEANCGVIIETEGRTIVSIKGDPENPLSRGHICPKGTALADLENDPDRLRAPVKRVGDGWQPIGWDQAYAEIAARAAAISAAGGAAAMYIGNPTAHNYSISSQLPLLRKALGTKATFSASSVDQVPHQLVQMWMFGHNALFPIPDIDRTQHMVIIGGNPLASNGSVWTVPDVKKRIHDMQARGGRLTVIVPRRTDTAPITSCRPAARWKRITTRCSSRRSRSATSPIIRRRCSTARRAPKAIGKSSPNSPAPSPAPPGKPCPTSCRRAKRSTGCCAIRRAG